MKEAPPLIMPPAAELSALPSHAQSLQRRLIALLLLVSSMSVLLLALWMHPSSGGVGTHEQLGLPACGLLQSTGVPCATCGMTTSFALAAHGQLIASFINQPGGAVLAIVTAMVAVAGAYTLVTGISLWPMVAPMVRPSLFIWAGVFFALAWLYKIAAVTGHLPGL